MPLKRSFPPKSKDDDKEDSKSSKSKKNLPPWLRKGKK
jgi:hypothetical protein